MERNEKMREYAIEVNNLSKSYGKLVAVDNISFKVKNRSTFGMLGLNGAGKTTTLKILVSLIRADKGQAIVAGYDVSKEPMEVRRNIGYVSENPGFYARMTALETLKYLSQLLDVPSKLQEERINECLAFVGLTDKKDKYVGAYSRGMIQRLALAQSLLSQPKVLFLDEPTLGLDPAGAKSIRELIIKMKKELNFTLIMSSHDLPEVEAICDEVAIFDHGKIVAQDSVDYLRNAAKDNIDIEVLLLEPDEAVVKALQSLNYINSIQVNANKLLVNVQRGTELRPQILETIYKTNDKILYFGIKESTLEEILFRTINRTDEK